MRLHPYLNFNGDCREAFTFYQQVLGGNLQMMSHGDTPMAEHVAPEWRDAIMHASLDLGDGTLLMASDRPQHMKEESKGTYVSLHVADAAEADRIYQALSENGTVEMPIQETFWAARFAMFVDRFGTSWMINCDPAS